MGINTLKYIERCLHIKTKEGAEVPFKLNAPQLRLYNTIKRQACENKPIRIIILKARQMGFSTLTEALLFKATATRKNTQSAIVAHVEEATTNLFNMSKFYYETLSPKGLQPKLRASNAKELAFSDLNSGIRCYTAAGHGIGRSATLQNLHISELAWWSCDKKQTLLGLLQAVPNNPGTTVIIESTANGYDYYKELWDKAISGESEYYPLFVGWNELDEYSKPYDGSQLTVEEQLLKEQYDLTDEQLSWRRWCIANQCGGDVELFRQEYPISPHEAFISTGTCVFDKESVLAHIAKAKPPIKQGEFTYTLNGNNITNRKWQDGGGGYVKIYKEPTDGRPYVIACDTAGEGSDYNAAHVIDNITSEQVAVIHGRMAEDIFAEQVYCLGKYYEDALIGFEVNFSTYPTRRIEQLGYRNLYVREVEDSISHQIKKSFGFRTTMLTRPLILSELIRLMRENIGLIKDKGTLQEMLTFIKNERGRMEAQQGSHDDLIMSLAIVYYIRGQQRTSVIVTSKQKRRMLPYEDDKQKTDSYVDKLFN